MPITAKKYRNYECQYNSMNSVRRSARGTKKDELSSEPQSVSATSDHEMEVDTNSDMKEFSLRLSPSKKVEGPSIKRDAPSFSGQHIFEQLTSKGAALKLTIDDWQELLVTNPDGATLQLLNTIFWVFPCYDCINLLIILGWYYSCRSRIKRVYFR